MKEYYYHVSCSGNRSSIAVEGLAPYLYTNYNVFTGPLYLSLHHPTTNIRDMRRPSTDRSTPILDDYMQLISYRFVECPQIDLYRVSSAGMDSSAIIFTDDPREIKYDLPIDTPYLKIIKTYDTRRLNEKYEENERAFRAANEWQRILANY
jgi:hypothetical protein